MTSTKPIVLSLLLSAIAAGCVPQPADDPDVIATTSTEGPADGVLTAGFVTRGAVYNSELMAPYDVFHHTVFRDSLRFIEPFIVTPDGEPFITFEGITITPHYSFVTTPPIDILVLPSTLGSMTADLEDEIFMAFVREAVARARYVVTVCDGAFPLAETGVLDGRVATTFPGDRDRFAERYPAIDVRYDERVVVDGKYITSVGGAMSYEPAFFLVEQLYGAAPARRIAQGLVWPWNPDDVPHLIVNREDAVWTGE